MSKDHSLVYSRDTQANTSVFNSSGHLAFPAKTNDETNIHVIHVDVQRVVNNYHGVCEDL